MHTKKIEVNSCSICPFYPRVLVHEYPREMCNLLNLEEEYAGDHKDDSMRSYYNETESPEWCPLRSDKYIVTFDLNQE